MPVQILKWSNSSLGQHYSKEQSDSSNSKLPCMMKYISCTYSMHKLHSWVPQRIPHWINLLFIVQSALLHFSSQTCLQCNIASDFADSHADLRAQDSQYFQYIIFKATDGTPKKCQKILHLYRKSAKPVFWETVTAILML